MQFLLILPQMTASRTISSGLNASFVLNPKMILKTSTFQVSPSYIECYSFLHSAESHSFNLTEQNSTLQRPFLSSK